MTLGPFELNKVYCGECSTLMAQLPNNCIDLTVTSPPYDNLRLYRGYTFDFEAIASQLYRITKVGSVVVWVVGDQTIDGSETGTSFKQALGFMEAGFKLHDTMIYHTAKPPLTHNRYEQEFEYMFVFSKGYVKTWNPIMIPYSHWTTERRKSKHLNCYPDTDGTIKKSEVKLKSEGRIAGNVWGIKSGYSNTSTDDKTNHPAAFPEALVHNHILSWTNPGDLVFDPMAGSGTTPKMAYLTGRNSLSFEISQEYVNIANRRLEATMSQPMLFNAYQPVAKEESIQLTLEG